MVDSRTLRWSDGALLEDPTASPNTNSLHVVDSWLMVDGAVAGLERHVERFTGSVRHSFPEIDVDSFVLAALTALPRTGRWFPRVEMIDDGSAPTLTLRIRNAPQPLTDVVLATATRDPRTAPTVKGPDLEASGALRAELAVGEAIILDKDEFIAEGAWSSIVWWEGESLHVVDSSIARLPSVTESLVLDLAQSMEVPVTSSRTRPTELDGSEVWVLSALHGIRVATEWRDGPSLHVEPGRAEHWRLEYAKNRRVVFSV